MKLATLTFVLVAAASASVGACSHDKPATATTTPTTDTPPPAQQQTAPPAQVQNDTPVSPGLAVSADIAALCGIKPSTESKFDYDKDELTKEDRDILDQLATCMTKGKLQGKTVSLIGRADPRGTEEYNLGLGSRRASSVGGYLKRLGVQQTQLAITTRGAIDATGTDESGWRQDRRVDVQLASPAG
jgi:peptidoglycan-associated lipoprotein|nr:OmpA family protein [Kofleriaceae bacterium]